MLKIKPEILASLNGATSLDDLKPYLQNAMELEHSTIPPYLTAQFSIMRGKNSAVAKIVSSIVIQEMLHLAIAANILNAIGGKPVIYAEDFIPKYPGPLPMNIGSLSVGLERCSKSLIENVFMAIEEPETPIVFPTKLMALKEETPEFATIGQFYRTLQSKIQDLAPDVLPGDPARQVTGNIGGDDLPKILNKKDVIDAIETIMEQGEGTSTSPLDLQNGIAHFYLFQQISKGKLMAADTSVPEKFSFSGDPIEIDDTGVFPISPNTRSADLASGSAERAQADAFNQSYAKILKALNDAFDGQPGRLDDSIDEMFTLRSLGTALVATAFPNKPGFTIGPPFEFVQI